MCVAKWRSSEDVSTVIQGFRVGDSAVEAVDIGAGRPLALIAGPCAMESEAVVTRIFAALRAICARLDMPLIFKASFDKANRTSLGAFRGPGLEAGLDMLARLRRRFGAPVTTDIHLPEQAAPAAQVVDLLQIPAYLCRQTDLVVAAGSTDRPVNIKKGQFLAPWDMAHVVHKARQGGEGRCPGVMVTERGSSFGYNNLVVDMRSLPLMREIGVPVCFDATHSVQLPGGQGERSGGQRRFVPQLVRAAVAVGIDALFLEVHDDPDSALSDGPNMVPLASLPALLEQVNAIDRARRLMPPLEL